MNIEAFNRKTARKNGYTGVAKSMFLIGERVQNYAFGNGVVRGILPTGAILVRFDGQTRDRSVFPSFLNRSASSAS